ncbi:MAG: HDOD domain-containing protein [Desulfopila sp.]|jgi:HD-like signal output (HDOD) protein|nr:HDOD domain-containing protein [Desulfopila sp.]
MQNSEMEQQEKRRKEIFARLNRDFKLPSPSATVLEVMRLCNSESSSLKEIADLIQTDPALSAEIINYANSAFLATGVQVASVQKATVKLGMKTVVNLALGFSLLSSNRIGKCAQFDYPLFWGTSLAEALAARELCSRYGNFDPDEIFITALLAHMGTLSMATLFPEEYATMLKDQAGNFPAKSREVEVFGIDRAEFTVELFLNWGMPAQYALAAGFHEDLGRVELGTGKVLQAATLLFLAHHIAALCQSTECQPETLKTILQTAEKYAVPITPFSELFDTIVTSWHEHGRLFDITTQDCYSYNEDDISRLE